MKNILAIILIFSLAGCNGCKNTVKEGVTLPDINIKLKINKDTCYFKIGDTISISTFQSSIINSNFKIINGEAQSKVFFGYYSQIPIINSYVETAKENIHLKIINNKYGKINFNANGERMISSFSAIPYGDSLKFEFTFVALKSGTYVFKVQSLFFEGTQGKARTNPYFDMVKNNGEELWQVPGYPALTPSDPLYKTLYYFAVTE